MCIFMYYVEGNIVKLRVTVAHPECGRNVNADMNFIQIYAIYAYMECIYNFTYLHR